MNYPSNCRISRLVITAFALALVPAVQAQVIQWGGTNGDYSTGSNWIGGVVPDTNAGQTALITAGNVTYTAGPDLAIHNGGTLEISGGSWTQDGGVSWIQLTGGNLVVSGGMFTQGTAGNIVKDAATTVTISAGTANFNGDYSIETSTLNVTGGVMNTGGAENLVLNGGNFSFDGGSINVGNEVKATGGSLLMSGGTLNANLLSFEATSQVFSLSGGLINLDAGGTGAFQGIFANADAYLDFTTGSTGTLFVNGLTAAASTSLFDSRVRYNGVADISNFNLLEQDGGLYITATIPEPTGLASLAIGLAGLTMLRRRRRMV